MRRAARPAFPAARPRRCRAVARARARWQAGLRATRGAPDLLRCDRDKAEIRFDLAQLYFNGRERSAGSRRFGIEVDEIRDLAPRSDERVRGSSVVLRERRAPRSRRRSADRCSRAGRARRAGARARRVDREGFELGDLKTQQLELGLPLPLGGRRLSRSLHSVCQRRRSATVLASRRRRARPAARADCRVEQRLMRVLPMNVEQQAAERLQVLKVDGLAVDECTRSPIGATTPQGARSPSSRPCSATTDRRVLSGSRRPR